MPNPLLVIVLLVAIVVIVVVWLRRRASGREAFERLVTQDLAERGISAVIEGDAVALPSDYLENGTIGLTNLWQTCADAPPAAWPDVIHLHFETLFAILRDQQGVQEQLADFAFAAPLLRLRLNAADSREEKAQLVLRPGALPGTVGYLVLDLPTFVRSVSEGEVQTWGQEEDVLFARALDNVWMQLQPEIHRLEFAPGFTCTMLSDESFFTATHALFLDRYPGCIGERGALVAVPTRDKVLAHALEEPLSDEHARIFALVARELAERGPGTLTTRLYWLHDGAFTELPYDLTDDDFTFSPPEAFREPVPVG